MEEGGLHDLFVVEPDRVQAVPVVDDVSGRLEQLEQAVGVSHQQPGAGGVPLQTGDGRAAAPHAAGRTERAKAPVRGRAGQTCHTSQRATPVTTAATTEAVENEINA